VVAFLLVIFVSQSGGVLSWSPTWGWRGFLWLVGFH